MSALGDCLVALSLPGLADELFSAVAAFSSYPSRLRRFFISSIDATCPDRANEKRVQALKLWDPCRVPFSAYVRPEQAWRCGVGHWARLVYRPQP
jgi:hypothetical protein